MAETKSATLTLDNKIYDLPIHSPTIGPDVLDIRKLYGEADVFTFDPGFTSTAACESAITYIDLREPVACRTPSTCSPRARGSYCRWRPTWSVARSRSSPRS